jgi:hypothetical protein
MHEFPEFAVAAAFYSMPRPTLRRVAIESKDHTCHEYNIPDAGPSGVFSIRETAWILGVDKSGISRLIRVGVLPTIRRRSRLVVPMHALARLLPAPREGRAR